MWIASRRSFQAVFDGKRQFLLPVLLTLPLSYLLSVLFYKKRQKLTENSSCYRGGPFDGTERGPLDGTERGPLDGTAV